MSTPQGPRAAPQYHPRLLELLAAPPPLAELSYLIGACIVDLIPLAAPASLPSPASDSLAPKMELPALPPIEQYIWEVAKRVRRPTGILLVVLVYISRLKKIIPPSAKGKLRCTHHRIFFGAFSLACKYLLDSKYDLARASGLFDPPSVAHIERELLSLFDYRMEISSEELTAQALVILHVYPDIRLHRSNRNVGPELPLPPTKRRKTDARLTHDTASPLTSPCSIEKDLYSSWSDSSDETPLKSPAPVQAPSPAPSPHNPLVTVESSPTPFNTAISAFSDLEIFHTLRSSSSSPVAVLTPPPSKASPSSFESPLHTPPSSPPPIGTPSQFSDENETYCEEDANSDSWAAVGRGTIFAGIKRKREDDD